MTRKDFPIPVVAAGPGSPEEGEEQLSYIEQQVQERAESVVHHPVRVTLLAERWDPGDAGLMW